jgi:hypothetical protein
MGLGTDPSTGLRTDVPKEILLKALPVGGNRMDDRLAIEETSKQFGERPLILDRQEQTLTPRNGPREE